MDPRPDLPPATTASAPQTAPLVDAVAVLLRQLGPWPQLGTNDKGQPLTLVDAVAELREDVGKLKGGQ